MVERPSSMLYLISDLRQKQSPQRSEGIIILVCCSLSQYFDPVRRNCTSPLNRLLGSRSRQLPAAVIASVNNIETRPGPTCLQVETVSSSSGPNDRAPRSRYVGQKYIAGSRQQSDLRPQFSSSSAAFWEHLSALISRRAHPSLEWRVSAHDEPTTGTCMNNTETLTLRFSRVS